MIKAKNFLSFLFFSGSKSLVFFTPLAILWLLGDSYYVLIEQTFATSLLIWPILALGMTSSYSYFFLEKKDEKFVAYYYRYLLLILLSIAVVTSVLYVIDNNKTESFLYITFIVFLMCFSYFISTVHKCNSDVIRSSCFDASPYFFFFLFLVSFTWNEIFGTVLMLFLSLLILLYTFWLSNKHSFRKTRTEDETSISLTPIDIKLYFSKSMHSFVVSWVAIAVVMFPRAFMAEYASVEESKELYLALRLGTFFVLIYQFIQIKMYSDVFKISAHNMRKVLLIYWCILLFILAALILFQLSLPYYFAVLYTGMWIMVSILELQVVRFGVQISVVKGALLVSPFIIFLLFIESFYYFLLFSIVLLILYVSVQAHSIYKKNFSLQIIILPIISAIGLLYYA